MDRISNDCFEADDTKTTLKTKDKEKRMKIVT